MNKLLLYFFGVVAMFVPRNYGLGSNPGMSRERTPTCATCCSLNEYLGKPGEGRPDPFYVQR